MATNVIEWFQCLKVIEKIRFEQTCKKRIKIIRLLGIDKLH